MSRASRPRAELADLARQTRELLARVRDSRWPGFDAEPVAATAATPPPGPAARRAAVAPPPAARVAPAAPPSRAAVAPEAVAPAPWGSLADVAAAVASCAACPLHATRKSTVPGEGNPRARLMFVGEAPGEDEDRQGRPFVGRAGQLLDRMIAAMGLSRGEVFIANVLKCRPPGNRDPEPGEVAACIPYLHAQIGLVRPEVICSLGRFSAQALLERTEPIGRLRGKFFEYRGTPLLPTFHPSYLLRSEREKVTAWKDLQLVMARLGIPPPERKKGTAAP